jgi:hypothetical protein
MQERNARESPLVRCPPLARWWAPRRVVSHALLTRRVLQRVADLAISTASLAAAPARRLDPALSVEDALTALDEIRGAVAVGDAGRAERALQVLSQSRGRPATLDALTEAGAVAVALSATRAFCRVSPSALKHCCRLLVHLGVCARQQAAVTDGVVGLLREKQTQSSLPDDGVVLASVCATVLVAVSFRSDEDYAEPGSYALHAGALPLLEAALAVRNSGEDFWATIELAVRKLRAVKAANMHARLQQAKAANDTAELIALARESIALSDSNLALHAITFFGDVMSDASDDEELLKRCLDAALAAGCLATLVKATEAFGRTDSKLLHAVGCVVHHLSLLRVPRVVALAIAVLNVAVDAPPARDDVAFQLIGLATVLNVAGMSCDAALRAKMLDAGVVERLVAISSDARSKPHLAFYFEGLIFLCGPLNAAPDACALRVITAGGLGVAIAATQEQQKDPRDEHEVEFGLMLLARLQELALAMKAQDAVVVSIFRANERKIFDVLDFALTELAHTSTGWALNILTAQPWFAKAVGGGRCSPACAAVVTNAMLAALHKMLPQHAASAELAGAFAGALRAFAGGCGGDDASAPGAHALHGGALPLLESMLPAVEAELAAGGLDKADRKQRGAVADFVRTLRALEASREAIALRAAAALVAEEETERARRSKGGKKAKSAKSKAAPPAALAEAVEPMTAAVAAVSVADAAASMAPAEPPAAEPLPAAQPQPDAAPAAPPPLPPWLLQAMLAPPPQPTPPIAPPLQPLAAPPPAMPPGPQGVPLPATQAVPLSSLVQQPRWEVPPPPKAPAGAWGRRPPAIPGMALSRESECAICLDAVAVGRTPCCGQTAFCAPCTATLRAECPLCRALPPSATS